MAVSPTYIYGSRKARTSNRIVKSYLLYHWAINPNWVSLIRTSIAHSQKMLTCLLVYHSCFRRYVTSILILLLFCHVLHGTHLPNQGIEPKFTIYKIVVLTVVLIRLTEIKSRWSARGSNPYYHSERVGCWPVAQANRGRLVDLLIKRRILYNRNGWGRLWNCISDLKSTTEEQTVS